MDALDQSLADIRQRRDSSFARMRAAGGAPAGGVPSTPISPDRLNSLSSEAQMAHHDEQLRHNRGRVYSPVKLKARRIAGQPIHVARPVKKGTKVSRGKTPFDLLRLKAGCQWQFDQMIEGLPLACKAMNDQLEILPEHDIAKLIQDPNPTMVAGDLIFVTVEALEITGKAHWWLKPQPPRSGRSHEIWYYPPGWWAPDRSKGMYGAWKLRPGNGAQTYTIPAEEVVYFYNPDPADPFGALSTVQALARVIESDEGISESQRRVFKNDIFSNLLITIGRHPDIRTSDAPRPMLTDKQRNEIISWVRANLRGAERAGDPIIQDALIEKVERLVQNPREMDYLRSSEVTRDQINEGFGVNPISMGRVEGSNRASSGMADAHFVGNTVNPDIAHLSAAMTAWLVPMFAGKNENLIVFIEPAKVIDREMDLLDEQAGVAEGIFRASELRSKRNLDPIAGLEKYLVTPQGFMPIPGTGVDLGDLGDGGQPADGGKPATSQDGSAEGATQGEDGASKPAAAKPETKPAANEKPPAGKSIRRTFTYDDDGNVLTEEWSGDLKALAALRNKG